MGDQKNIKERRRIIIVLCALLVTVLIAASTDPTKDNDDYAKCRQQADEVHQSAVLKLDNTEIGLPSDSEIKKQHQQAKQQYLDNLFACNDLDAQLTMARIAHYGLFVGIVGLLAIMVTLWETLNANKMLRKQSNLSAMLGRLEYQPIIEFSKLEVVQKPIPHHLLIKSGELKLLGRMSIKNTGKTPAHSLFLRQMAEISYPYKTENGMDTHYIRIEEQITFFNETIANTQIIKDFDVRLSFKTTENTPPLAEEGAGVRLKLLTRLSFTDVFDLRERRVHCCRYEGRINIRDEFEPKSSREIGASDKDYPEYWTKKDEFLLLLAGMTITHHDPQG